MYPIDILSHNTFLEVLYIKLKKYIELEDNNFI